MDLLQCFTFLLGVYVASLGLTCATDLIPDTVKEDISKVKEHFKTGNGDKALFGHPVFVKYLKNLDSNYEVAIQKLIVHEILEAYVTLLRTMIKNTKNKEVQASIANIEGAFGILQKKFPKYNDLKKVFQELWAIKTDDLLTQRRGILELREVFQKASNLAIKTSKTRRRRRQVLRRGLY